MLETIKDKLLKNSDMIEKSLASYYEYDDKDYSEIIEAQRYSLLGGGKRIRAFITMQISHAFDGNELTAQAYACAIEMIHAYSLIHDDLPCMDNDDMRRGKPSSHKAFGEAVALLAGDALLTKAFHVVSTNPHNNPEANLKAVKLLSEAAGDRGMIGGQTIDIRAAREQIDFDTLLKLHGMKTGKLICASAALGCIAAGIDENDERYALSMGYAQRIGLAFQIIDDILEYENGEEENNSFLSFMTCDKAKEYAIKISTEACEIIKGYDKDNTLRELAEYLIQRKI